MAVLVDTCGWIEWLTDGPLADRYAGFFEAPDAILVPTAVQFELYKWTRRARGEAVALEAVALTEQGIVQPLTTAIALLAGEHALEYGLSFADALIYSTARYREVDLVTADRHFQDLPGVTLFHKGVGAA
jgi:predicted nucleic acid-binding protein